MLRRSPRFAPAVETITMFSIKRTDENPLLSPLREHPWEAAAAFNWCPVTAGRTTHVLYRALSVPELLDATHRQVSVIGHAVTADGIHFRDRKPFITPTEEWERFGCEDPRATKLGSTYYIFYTALSTYPFSAEGIHVALAMSKNLTHVKEKHLVTPFNAKAMALFPEKIGGKFAALLTAHTDMPPAHLAYAEFEKEEQIWSPEYWQKWHEHLLSHALNVKRSPEDHVELGAPPLKTAHGWLIIYAHIQHYFGGGNRVFGIEALLLDRKNPRKIVGRTDGPFLVPETHYEQMGNVPNVIFPSGAQIRGERLEIYYGAADTHCAIATVPLKQFLEALLHPGARRHIKRAPDNPIITPRSGLSWEGKGTFNPAAIDLDGTVHLLYRAQGNDDVSTFGYAASRNGQTIDERLPEPVYVPRKDFEQKKRPGNSGCEDPRLTRIGERLYMTYTAFDGELPRVAVSSIRVADFLARRWQWSEPILITPSSIAEKDTCIMPGQFGGTYLILHRVHESVCADFVTSLDFTKERIKQCIEVLSPRRGMWDGGKVGIAAPPLRVPKGWLLLYHGVSGGRTYRVGAALLDAENPTVVTARTSTPILTPEEEYEQRGVTPNVVFPCGAVLRGGTLYLYYGAADATVAVATIKLASLLRMLST